MEAGFGSALGSVDLCVGEVRGLLKPKTGAVGFPVDVEESPNLMPRSGVHEKSLPAFSALDDEGAIGDFSSFSLDSGFAGDLNEKLASGIVVVAGSSEVSPNLKADPVFDSAGAWKLKTGAEAFNERPAAVVALGPVACSGCSDSVWSDWLVSFSGDCDFVVFVKDG